MYRLYYFPGAASLAVHIVLEEIGQPYALELVTIDVASGAEGITAPVYLSVNPKGRVPALETDFGVLTETPAILAYLGRRHPEAGLWPDNPESEARCYEWMAWLASTLHAVAFGQVVRPQRFVHDAKDYPAVIAKGRKNVRMAYVRIEALLREHDWTLPDRYTVVDPYLLFFYLGGRSAGLPMQKHFPD